MRDSYADIRPLVAQGWSNQRISQHLGTKAALVRRRRKNMLASDARKAAGAFNPRAQRAAERDTTVARMKLDGFSHGAISAAMNVSVEAVGDWCRKLRRMGMLPLGRENSTGKSNPTFWTPERVALAVKMRHSGLTVGQTAQRLGTSADAVSVHTAEACRNLPGGLDERRQARRDATEIRQADAADVPRPSTRAERRCLGGCGEMFSSQHVGNRVCAQCQNGTAWRSNCTDVSLHRGRR